MLENPSNNQKTIDFSQISLNAGEIFSCVSDREVFEYYTSQEVKIGKKVKCGIHSDKNPSMTYYLHNTTNRLQFKCFACGKFGSVITYVRELYNLGYHEALERISQDFKLTATSVPVNLIVKTHEVIPHKIADTKIIPIIRSFSEVDFNYWSSFHISLDTVLEYDVNPCESVYLVKNGVWNLVATHSNNNPIYCYNVNGRYKIYRPLDLYGKKWMGTTKEGDIQGAKQLNHSGLVLIITSSLKDVMVFKTMGYEAVAFGSEGAKIPESWIKEMRLRFEHLVVYYDNDDPGIEYAKKTGLPYIMNPIFEPKDISDYVRKYGLAEGKNLVGELFINNGK